MDRLMEARKVFNIEISALEKVRDALDDTFEIILSLITNCKGKVIITGMGKPGHIAAKLASTFASLGTPSFRLHPAEAMHGDLGMITSEDVVIAISFSGESEEIIRILPNIKLIGAKLIGLTGNRDSALAQAADVVQVFPKFSEACGLGLAPTSSTTVTLCYGDALAVVASKIYDFKDENFALFHPAGTLGKKLILKVKDLMITGVDNPVVNVNAPMRDAIIELSKKGIGAVSVVNDEGNLVGIITDGDLRRQLLKGVDIYSMCANKIMSVSPRTINGDCLAVDALNIMKKQNISCLVVSEDGKATGIITFRKIIEKGIII